MSSKRGGGQFKGKNVAGGSGYDADHLNQGVQAVNLDSNQDGDWEEVTAKKNKNKVVNAGPSKQRGSQTPIQKVQVPTQQRTIGGGRGNGQVRPPNNGWPNQAVGRGGASYYIPPSNPIPPPPQGVWSLNSRPPKAWEMGIDNTRRPNIPIPEPIPEPAVVEEAFEDPNDNDDLDDDDSDDDLHSDEYDSDQNSLSHEERKKNRWYAVFFQTLEGLTIEQMNEPTRQWHCPACQNGPGAIDWYKSLQSLVTHAKTKGSKRVKIHRDLAMLLEEELRIRGAAVNPSGESYGQWKGLNAVVKDKEIVWPPMVIIMNTQLEQDENDKWVGMGNQELLDYFGSYEAVKARHAYGPKGHRGMSLLIFEGSAVGYTEAERLSKHFEHEGTDRDAWDHPRRVLFYPGGKRQLYGFMATKRDMDYFNQHSQGKMKLKFDLVSYQEKVVNQLKQMNEDNQQLNYYKNKAIKEKRHSKAIEEYYSKLSQKLRKSEEEKRIVRDRTKRYSEQTKEQMDFQDQFFREQLKGIEDGRNEQEGQFDKIQQEECIRFEQSDPKKRDEKLEELKEYEEEREKLIKLHEAEKIAMKKKHMEEEVELVKGHADKLAELRQKYTPKHDV